MNSNISDFVRALFDCEIEKQRPAYAAAWLALLYASGLYFWGVFFDWRQTPLNYHDWRSVNLPRLDVIRDALMYGEFPLHVNRVNFLHYVTDRFLTMPDVITSPQQIALYWLDVDTFAVFDLLIAFTTGIIGLYLFKQKYNISLFAFAVMYFLFSFNGYVQSHYSVGHITWGGYFLFPLLILLVTDFMDGQPGWGWTAKVAFLLFYMVLIGSQHHFVWSLIFLGGAGLAAWNKMRWAIRAGFFAGMLSAVRLLPPTLVIPEIRSTSAFAFRTGFPHLQDVLASLALVRSIDYRFPSLPAEWFASTRYWEFNIYVGAAGTLIILWFGVVSWLTDWRSGKRFSQLGLPVLLVFLLSLGRNYNLLIMSNIPLFATERITSRMIGLPLTAVIMLSAVFLSAWLRAIPALPRYGVSILGAAWLARDLFAHVDVWGVKTVSEALVQGYGRVIVQGNSISNHADPVYIAILGVGAFLTFAFSALLLALVRRERVQKAVPLNGEAWLS